MLQFFQILFLVLGIAFLLYGLIALFLANRFKSKKKIFNLTALLSVLIITPLCFVGIAVLSEASLKELQQEVWNNVMNNDGIPIDEVVDDLRESYPLPSSITPDTIQEETKTILMIVLDFLKDYNFVITIPIALITVLISIFTYKHKMHQFKENQKNEKSNRINEEINALQQTIKQKDELIATLTLELDKYKKVRTVQDSDCYVHIESSRLICPICWDKDKKDITALNDNGFFTCSLCNTSGLYSKKEKAQIDKEMIDNSFSESDYNNFLNFSV